MPDRIVQASRFMSLALRHRPGMIGLELDANGWARVDDLIARSQRSRMPLSLELIREVVATNDKQRFAFSEDGQRIRASQGHSIHVDLGLEPREPPELLYHGTARASVASIRRQGLLKGKRQHVHISLDEATATKVGSRHGQPVVLVVRAGEMWRAGTPFYLSENGVWLTEHVPAQYLAFPEEG